MLQGLYRATVEVLQEARAVTESSQATSEPATDSPDDDEESEESEELGPLSRSDQAALEAFAEEFELPDDLFARVGISGVTSDTEDGDEVPFLETESPDAKAQDLIDLEDMDSLPSLSDYDPMTPELIASWQRTVEENIARVLSLSCRNG